jgi:hypothetical protein
MRKWIGVFVCLCIIFCLQAASAQTWSKTKRLTNNLGDSEEPDIAIDSNNVVHIVFHDDTPDWIHDEIFYKRSTNGGTSWTTKRLTWNPDHSSYPAIAIDSSDNIHVVWQDISLGNYEIYYRKSTNGGNNWSVAERLTWNTEESRKPDVAVDSSGDVYVFWYNIYHDIGDIYWRKSTDNGTSWAGSKRFTWNSEWSFAPDIAIDSNDHIYVVWEDFSPGVPQILFKKSTNGGTSWFSKQLTWNGDESRLPNLTIDTSDNLHLVWEDDSPGAPEIYYKKSAYGGTSWSPTRRLTWAAPPCISPKIARDSNNRIHVLWASGNDPEYDIFYKRSTNSGGTWMTKRLTWIPGRSKSPAVAVAPNNNIYVVWQDENPGNMEIYLKKGIQ